jgi:hypothetical protein
LKLELLIVSGGFSVSGYGRGERAADRERDCEETLHGRGLYPISSGKVPLFRLVAQLGATLRKTRPSGVLFRSGNDSYWCVEREAAGRRLLLA